MQKKTEMLQKIEELDGVQWALGINSLVGPSIPESMIPEKLRSMLQSDNYELQFICSRYRTATDEVNQHIAEIQEIVKSCSPQSMVIG